MPVHLGPHQTDLGQFQVPVQSRFKTGTAFYFKPFYMGSMVEGGRSGRNMTGVLSTFGCLVKVIRSFYCTSVLTSDATPSTSYRYFSTETPLQKPSYVTQLASVLPYHNPINTSSSTDQKTAPKWLPTFLSSCFLLSSRLSSLPLTANSLNSPLLTITVKGMEKKTSLHFYFHDIPGGKNQTSTTIAQPLNMTAAANFLGSTSRADVLLREGPEPISKLVGRAQGIYAFASQHNAVLLMVMNFAFVDGIYNGSSLSILGRKAIFDIVREMPVAGGSGVFRLARGHALAKTFSFNLKAGVAVIEYMSVVHF
uniref:Dirigent protein n=1 Tax=Populus alba TaxID=43335 RepID=A0A4U5Q5R4_POPAL|nr:dirigent protein 22-like [Populus alba]